MNNQRGKGTDTMHFRALLFTTLYLSFKLLLTEASGNLTTEKPVTGTSPLVLHTLPSVSEVFRIQTPPTPPPPPFTPVFYSPEAWPTTTMAPCTKDKVICDAVEQFQKHCPFTFVCNFELNARLRSMGFSSGNKKICCEPCNCSDDCGTECCPDKPSRYINQSEIQLIKTASVKCVLPRYITYTEDISDSYEMIAQCPVGYDNNTIRGACLRDYIDFDFQENVINFMPASSNKTKTTYKNRYCALCHGEQDSDLHFWNTQMTCLSKAAVIVSLTDIPKVIRRNMDCNIIFFIPNQMQETVELTKCRMLIDTCNTTGAWRDYDSTIETACMSYTSEYKGYKNVHCYLCNGHEDVPVLCFNSDGHRSPSSFIALLDFNNLENTVEIIEKDGEDCKVGERYDTIAEECRPLLCSKGLLERNGRCTSVYRSFSTSGLLVFEIAITLQPNSNLGDVELLSPEDLRDNLTKYVRDKYENEIAFVSRNMVCDIQTFVQLKQNLSATYESMLRSRRTLLYSDTKYLGLVMKLNIYNTDLNSTRLIDVLEPLVRVNQSVFGNFSVESRRVSELETDRLKSPFQATTDDINQELANLSSVIQIPNWLSYGLVNGYDIASGKSSILPIKSNSFRSDLCNPILSIETYPYCAKVKISSSEYKSDSADGRIYLPNVDRYIDRQTVSFVDDDLLMCSDTYFGMVDNYMTVQKRKLVTDETLFDPLSIMTILCISISLLALLITFIIYCRLSELRTLPGRNNMALIICLFAYQTLTLVNTCVDVTLSWLCSAIGLTLHVALLSSTFWMFVCTYHMMKVFLMKTPPSANRNMRKFIYYILFVCVATLLLVGITITVSYTTRDPPTIGYGGKPCYITHPNMILYTVAIPVGIVVIANIAMFISVVISISRSPDMHASSTGERRSIAIFAKLSTITGLTWIFGFIYQFSHVVAFAYIFIIFNAGQGVFIMFSFVLNKRVVNMLRPKKPYVKRSDKTPEKNIALHSEKSEKSTCNCGDEFISNQTISTTLT